MHPARYRTQLCTEGGACNRRVCFFAHSVQELRAAPAKQPDSPPNSPPNSEALFYSDGSMGLGGGAQCAREHQDALARPDALQLYNISDFWDEPAAGGAQAGEPEAPLQQLLRRHQLQQQEERAGADADADASVSPEEQQQLLLQLLQQQAGSPPPRGGSPPQQPGVLSVEQLAALLRSVGVTADSLAGERGAQLLQLLGEQQQPQGQQAPRPPAGAQEQAGRGGWPAQRRTSRRSSSSLPLLVIPEDPVLPPHSGAMGAVGRLELLLSQLTQQAQQQQQQQQQQLLPGGQAQLASPYAIAAAAAAAAGLLAPRSPLLAQPLLAPAAAPAPMPAPALLLASQHSGISSGGCSQASSSYHTASSVFDMGGMSGSGSCGGMPAFEAYSQLAPATSDSSYGRASFDSCYSGGGCSRWGAALPAVDAAARPWVPAPGGGAARPAGPL